MCVCVRVRAKCSSVSLEEKKRFHKFRGDVLFKSGCDVADMETTKSGKDKLEKPKHVNNNTRNFNKLADFIPYTQVNS